MAEQQKEIQVHISPDADYKYRDICNIFIGPGDVVFEFGNHHRSTPEHATIADRVVMTVPQAIKLRNTLDRALTEAEKQLEEAQK
jgi:hypothetical protein